MTLKFGDYDVDALLGPGSVTETYRASRAGGPPVALKLLRPDRGGKDAKVRSTFLATARRNKVLRLSGVAKILDVQEGSDVFVVSELLSGANLEGLFESATVSGSLEPALVGQIGIQIARILTRMHERREPVFHGALCPGNVIVTSGGRVTLLDVGFTAALRPLTQLPIDRSWFVAPEIALDGKAPSVASDLYGLGAVLYYLLTGEPPVMGETDEELAELFDEGPADIPGLPDWLNDALASLLARHPEDRPRTAAAAALCLNPFPDGATRLGAIVSGKQNELPTLPAPDPADPMAARGTMVVSGGDAQAPLPALGFGESSDELRSPFDSDDSDPVMAAPPASPPARELPRAPSPGAKPSSPFAEQKPLTLTPLRPSALLPVGEESLTPPGTSAGVGPPSVGLPSEPQWAAEPAPSGLSLASAPSWADDDLSPAAPDSAPGQPALANEPQWVDGGPSLVMSNRHASLPVEDFLDLGAPAPGPAIKLAGLGAGVEVAKVDLPELLDVEAPPSVSSSSLQAVDDVLPPQGMVTFGSPVTGGDAGGALPIGAIGFSEEEEEGAGSGGGPSSGGFNLPQVPRRAGSARIGSASSKSSPTKIAVGALIVAGLGAVAFKALDKPTQVLPTPQEVAKKHGEADPTAPKPIAQNADEVAAPSRGELSIVTTPQGATIWVDGKERGRTPLTIQTTPGTHRVVIVKPGFKMLREVTDTTEGLTIKRTLPPANINFGGNVVLKVECKTEGKYPVFVDGKDTGLLCPIDNLKIPGGNRLIGLYVIPDNKVWSFEREVVVGTKAHRVVFSY